MLRIFYYIHPLIIIIVGEEFSQSHYLLTFPEGASQGDRECVTITFFQDNVTDEGLKCFTLGVYDYYYYNYHDEYHTVPVCKTDGGEQQE